MSDANKELSRRFTELIRAGDEALAEEVLIGMLPEPAAASA